VDPAVPWVSARLAPRRQLELQRLAVGVQNHVDQQSAARDLRRERQAMGGILPVRLVELHAVPGTMRLPEQVIQTDGGMLGLHLAQQPPAVSSVTNRCTSACFATSVQSNQLVSLSWQ